MPSTPFTVQFAGAPLTLAACPDESDSTHLYVERIEDGSAVTDAFIRVERGTGEMHLGGSVDELIHARIGVLPLGGRHHAGALAAGAGHVLLGLLRFLGEVLGLVGRTLLLSILSPVAALGGVIGIAVVVMIFGTIALYVLPVVAVVAVALMVLREVRGRRNLRRALDEVDRLQQAVALHVVHLLATDRQTAEEFAHAFARNPQPKRPDRVAPVEGGLNCQFALDNIYVGIRPLFAFLPETAPEPLRRRQARRMQELIAAAGAISIAGPARVEDSNVARASILLDGETDLGLALIREGLALPHYEGGEDIFAESDIAHLRHMRFPVEVTDGRHAAVTAMLEALGARRGMWEPRSVAFTRSPQAMAFMSNLEDAGLMDPGVDVRPAATPAAAAG